LYLSGYNTYPGRTVLKVSAGVPAGKIVLSGNAAGVLSGGTATSSVLAGGGADLQAVTISGSITTSMMVFDYSGGGTDPVAAIRAALIASRNGGLANDMTTGLFNWNSTLAQFESTTALALGLTIGYYDNTLGTVKYGHDPHTVTVMATYPGDFNLDGAVDGQDRSIYLAHAGQSGQDWFTGDANYDGNVDGMDRGIYLAEAGKGVVKPLGGDPLAGNGPTVLGGVVPEPGTLALLLPLVALFGYVVARRRRK